MTAFMHEHPWMTFWLLVLIILCVESQVENALRVRAARYGLMQFSKDKKEEEEDD